MTLQKCIVVVSCTVLVSDGNTRVLIYDGPEIFVLVLYGSSKNIMALPWYMSKHVQNTILVPYPPEKNLLYARVMHIMIMPFFLVPW